MARLAPTTCVADDDVDSPPGLDHLADGLRQCFAVGYIGFERDRPASQRLHLVGGRGAGHLALLRRVFLERLEVHIEDGDVGAHARQLQCVGAAEAASCAGHKGGLPF
jgi:hypothetical protein